MPGRSLVGAARPLGASILLGLATGCQVVLGIDEWPAGFGGAATSASTGSTGSTSTSSTTSSVTSSSSTGGGVACGADRLLVCKPWLPIADGTWSVPGALVDGASSSCPFLPVGSIELATNVVASMCACESPPQPPLCSAVSVISDDMGCGTTPHGDASTCNLLPAGGASVLASKVISANCSSPGAAPEPILQGRRVVCAPAPDPACEANEKCVPPGAPVCVVHEGVVACPPGYTPTAGSPFTKVDGYDCSTCIRPASLCDGQTRVWADMGCSSATTTIVPNDGACTTLAFDAQSFEWFPNPNNDVPDCGPVAQKILTSVHTVCCL